LVENLDRSTWQVFLSLTKVLCPENVSEPKYPSGALHIHTHSGLLFRAFTFDLKRCKILLVLVGSGIEYWLGPQTARSWIVDRQSDGQTLAGCYGCLGFTSGVRRSELARRRAARRRAARGRGEGELTTMCEYSDLWGARDCEPTGGDKSWKTSFLCSSQSW